MWEIAKLSSKQQATIPSAIRRLLRLRPGDRLVFEIVGSEANPVVRLHRYPTLEEIAGSVPVPPEVRGLEWSDIRARAWAPGPADSPADA